MIELAHSLSWFHPSRKSSGMPMAYRVMIPSDQVLIPGHKIPLNRFIESDMSMFCTNRILPKFTTMNYLIRTLCAAHPWAIFYKRHLHHINDPWRYFSKRLCRIGHVAFHGFPQLLMNLSRPRQLLTPKMALPLHDGPSFPLFHWYWYIYIYNWYLCQFIYIYIDLLLKPRNSRVSSCVLAEKGSLPRSMKYRMTPAANTSTSGDWQGQQHRSSLTGDAEGFISKLWHAQSAWSMEYHRR